jgi:hypothetical protein
MCPRGAMGLDGFLPASLLRHVVPMLWPTPYDAARRTTTITVLVVAFVTALTISGPAGRATAATRAPTDLDHVMHTTPFDGSSVSMRDNEGSAYVPDDNSLWLADDNRRRLYEVDATSGQHKRTISPSDLSAVPQYGGGPVAGVNRSTDLEAIAYDADTDSLFVFSGNNQPTDLPTAFRLTRQDGSLGLTDYQPLDPVSDFTAAGWNQADGTIYVGKKKTIRPYDYEANTAGGPIPAIRGVSHILGMDFSPDGSELIVTQTVAPQPPAERKTELASVDWESRDVNWRFDLSPSGVLDARAVAYVDGALLVSDGFDFRAAGDPLNHAVFVYSGATAP